MPPSTKIVSMTAEAAVWLWESLTGWASASGQCQPLPRGWRAPGEEVPSLLESRKTKTLTLAFQPSARKGIDVFENVFCKGLKSALRYPHSSWHFQ